MIKGTKFPRFAARRNDLHCTPDDARTFHPKRYGEDNFSVHRAKQLCRHCPAKDECLLWALTQGETSGIWGGRTPLERDAILRKARQIKNSTPPYAS